MAWTSSVDKQQFREGRLYITVGYNSDTNPEKNHSVEYDIETLVQLQTIVNRETDRLNGTDDVQTNLIINNLPVDEQPFLIALAQQAPPLPMPPVSASPATSTPITL